MFKFVVYIPFTMHWGGKIIRRLDYLNTFYKLDDLIECCNHYNTESDEVIKYLCECNRYNGPYMVVFKEVLIRGRK